MKWRHWAILIVLVLLNYIVFSAAFTRMAAQQRPLHVTHTPMPTFTVIAGGPVGWVVLPTSTAVPTGLPPTRTPLPTATIAPLPSAAEPADTVVPTGTDTAVPPTTEAPTAEATATSAPTPSQPPAQTPGKQYVLHTVKRGEYLSLIAAQYGVSVQAIMRANSLTDANHIVTGQKLVIPLGGQAPVPTATRKPANPTSPPPNPTGAQATATPRPATATAVPPTATSMPSTSSFQFTGEVIWDPQVAPNCSGPAISRQSMVLDTAGNPVNGVRIEVDCYGNTWVSHPTGNPGEYDAGHYDFAFGQSSPQAWTCTARVFDLNGVPVTSSQAVSIYFDTNACQPGGSGHQVAIVNWVKNW